MDSPYPTYDAVYNSGNPSLNAANLLNNAAIMNQVCSQCAEAQQPGGYTAISVSYTHLRWEQGLAY